MEIILINELEELDEFQKDWDCLLEICEGTIPLQSFGWTKVFLKQYSTDGKNSWVCFLAYKNDELIAVYPLVYQKSKRIPGLHLQWFHPPHDAFHTVRIDGLILPGHEYILELIVDKIRRVLKIFPIIQISKIPEHSASYRSVACFKSNLHHFIKPAGNEEFIEANTSLEDYLLGLNGKFRSEMRRIARRLEERYRISYIFGCNDHHERCLAEFIKLEDSGWKGKNNTSLNKREKDLYLFKKGTGYLNDKGWIEWNFLKVNDKIIAAQMHIKKQGVSFLWKTAYNESYSDYSPGNILLFKYIQNAIQEKLYEEINFLDERKWFERWNVKKRKLFNVIIFPKVFLLSNILKIYYKIRYS